MALNGSQKSMVDSPILALINKIMSNTYKHKLARSYHCKDGGRWDHPFQYASGIDLSNINQFYADRTAIEVSGGGIYRYGNNRKMWARMKVVDRRKERAKTNQSFRKEIDMLPHT